MLVKKEKWTKKEMEILRVCFKNFDAKVCQKVRTAQFVFDTTKGLTKRTAESIRSKARAMGF